MISWLVNPVCPQVVPAYLAIVCCRCCHHCLIIWWAPGCHLHLKLQLQPNQSSSWTNCPILFFDSTVSAPRPRQQHTTFATLEVQKRRQFDEVIFRQTTDQLQRWSRSCAVLLAPPPPVMNVRLSVGITSVKNLIWTPLKRFLNRFCFWHSSQVQHHYHYHYQVRTASHSSTL